MTNQEIEAAVHSVLPRCYIAYYDERNQRVCVKFADGVKLTMQQLIKLGETLGTSHIDLVFDPGCEDYSSVTAGEPAELMIYLGEVKHDAK